MADVKPKKKRVVKKVKPQIEKPKEEKKEEDSWENFLDDESFEEETEKKEQIATPVEVQDNEEYEIEEETEDIDEDEIEEAQNNTMIKEEKNEDIKTKVGDIKFPVLDKTTDGKKITQDMFGNIPIEVTVELGRTSVSLKDVYELNEGSIIELERLAGEPLDLVVNGQIVAHGEVVAVDDNYGLRITKILTEQ